MHIRGMCTLDVATFHSYLLIVEKLIPALIYTVSIQRSRKESFMGRCKDWTGQKYGKLTFIKPTDQRVNSKVIWELLCECGKITFKRADNIIRGETISCGCVMKELRATFGERAVRKYDPAISSARAKWAHNYSDCDFDLFLKLSQQPCHYCGREPHRTCRISSAKKGISKHQLQDGDFTYNGLDRIDNTKGHTSDNVVPSCWDCNHMKGKRTVEEFLSHIERILTFTARRFAEATLPRRKTN